MSPPTKFLLLVALVAIAAGSSVYAGKFSKLSKLMPKSWSLKAFINPTDKPHTHEYDRINDFLTKNVSSNDAYENLAAAKQYLETIKADTSLKLISNHYMADALAEFIQLSSLIKKDQTDLVKCGRKSVHIIANNDRSARNAIHRVQTESGEVRRIDEIVYFVANEHATKCLDFYIDHLESLYHKMPEKIYDRATELTKLLAALYMIQEKKLANPQVYKDGLSNLLDQAEKYIDSNPLEAAAYVSNISCIYIHEDVDIISNLIERYAGEDGDSKRMVLKEADTYGMINKPFIRDLFQKYLVNLCVDFNNWHDNVVLPIKFDLQVNSDLLNGRDNPFEHAIFVFETCNKFLAVKDKAERDLLKHIKWVATVLADD